LFTARTRIPQKSEVYSKLCYEDKIKPVTQVRCEEQQAKSRGAKLRVINEVTREMLEKELPEVKEQVEAVWSDLQTKCDVVVQSPASRTAEDYSR
jgi:enterochelin esterase-like enzyme